VSHTIASDAPRLGDLVRRLADDDHRIGMTDGDHSDRPPHELWPDRSWVTVPLARYRKVGSEGVALSLHPPASLPDIWSGGAPRSRDALLLGNNCDAPRKPADRNRFLAQRPSWRFFPILAGGKGQGPEEEFRAALADYSLPAIPAPAIPATSRLAYQSFDCLRAFWLLGFMTSRHENLTPSAL
jgi:hypothetical protein